MSISYGFSLHTGIKCAPDVPLPPHVTPSPAQPLGPRLLLITCVAMGPMGLGNDCSVGSTRGGSKILHRNSRKIGREAPSCLLQLTPLKVPAPPSFSAQPEAVSYGSRVPRRNCCCWQVLPDSRPPRCFLTSAWRLHCTSVSLPSPPVD